MEYYCKGYEAKKDEIVKQNKKNAYLVRILSKLVQKKEKKVLVEN